MDWPTPTWIDAACAALGGLALVVGIFADALRGSWASAPMLAVAVGAALGPYGTGVLTLPEAHAPPLLDALARVALAFVLIGSALRLPRRYFIIQWRPLAILLIGGMAGMWLATSAVLALTLGVPWAEALVIGAVAAPTDPVLASAVGEGRRPGGAGPDLIPLLEAESSANDAVAFPLVMAALAYAGAGRTGSWWTWADQVLLRETGLAAVIGAAVGFAIGSLHVWSTTRGYTSRATLLGVVWSMALGMLGLAGLLGVNPIIMIFAASVALDCSRLELDAQERSLHQAVVRLVQLPLFVAFGVALPWHAWAHDLGWPAALAAAAVLLLRRIPVVTVLGEAVPQLARPWCRLYAGWFGPIGVATILYALQVDRSGMLPGIWPTASLLVVASIIAHGLSAAPLTRRLRETATTRAPHPAPAGSVEDGTST